MTIWNPWHGCIKISSGCKNCYVYRRDESFGKDASEVKKTKDFNLPIQRTRGGEPKIASGTYVFACMTSDFFIEQADVWRDECWAMIKRRQDLHFAITTKRIDRFIECIPDDWGNGYPNVSIHCTVENQEMADYRIPILLSSPIASKHISHEPMLERIDISRYLASGQIQSVLCGGESGYDARPCDYDWVLDTRKQCIDAGVPFHFKQTGALFIKDGKTYHIKREIQQSQAAKANIDYAGEASMPVREEDADWLSRDLFERIAESDFRSSFKLSEKDIDYIEAKGLDVIRSHAMDFIAKRVAPKDNPNDGKQTPMRGHPVFKAQHACGCCCRGCLEKWHGIERGKDMTPEEIDYAVDVIMEWISRQFRGSIRS